MGSCQSVSSKEVRSDQKHKGKPQILIKTFTWSRDSHGLFDYESKTLAKKNLKSIIDGSLARRGNDILLNKEGDQMGAPGDDEILKLKVQEGNYWAISSKYGTMKKGDEDWEDNNHSIWLVVKSFKAANAARPGFKLAEGDLMKLGRIKFRVKELRGSGSVIRDKKPTSDNDERHNVKTEEELVNKSALDEEPQRRNSKVSAAGSRTSMMQTCRICLGEQADAEDPFFSPCQCSGTMKYIHVLCLQKWLKSKLHVKQTGFSTSIYWKTLECELCKTTYPSSFEIEGKRYDVVEIDRPECGYLMLEILSKEKNILRGIHIIKMEGKSNIRLGRGHESDIRITDISVSRCHAMIKLDKGNFYLEDNNSKFGTLVHMKKPFALFGDYNNISLQIGRTVLSVAVKKNWKSLSNCFSSGQVGNPTEIEDDGIFGRIPVLDHHTHSSPNHREVHPVVGPIDHLPNNQGELASPANQDEDALDEDRLSNMSEEDFPEDMPENPEQPAAQNQQQQAGVQQQQQNIQGNNALERNEQSNFLVVENV